MNPAPCCTRPVAAPAAVWVAACLLATGALGGGDAPRAHAQGYTDVVYKGESPKKTYHVTITMQGGWGEDRATWAMDVLRRGKPVVSKYAFRPFYAWTCVARGRAQWQAESVLHFTNFSCEGRNINPRFANATGRTIPYTEVWLRSVGPQGFPHAPASS